MVHSLGPPAEEEHSVAAHALAGLVNPAVEIRIFEEILAVLVLENHPVPALHLSKPLRTLPVVPPGIDPGTVNAAGHVPRSRIWGHDIGIARPGLTAETMRIFEETELQAVKLAVIPLVGPETVPGILE